MEEGPHPRRPPHFRSRPARKICRTRPPETDRSLLRQRIPSEHRNEPIKTGGLQVRLQRAGKLAGLEEGKVSHPRGRRSMNPILLIADFGVNAANYPGGAWSPYLV